MSSKIECTDDIKGLEKHERTSCLASLSKVLLSKCQKKKKKDFCEYLKDIIDLQKLLKMVVVQTGRNLLQLKVTLAAIQSLTVPHFYKPSKSGPSSRTCLLRQTLPGAVACNSKAPEILCSQKLLHHNKMVETQRKAACPLHWEEQLDQPFKIRMYDGWVANATAEPLSHFKIITVHPEWGKGEGSPLCTSLHMPRADFNEFAKFQKYYRVWL